MGIETSASLNCHKATPCGEVRAIHVRVRRTRAELETHFRLDGNIARICLRPPGGPQEIVELWRHTCFEVFVAVEGQTTYHEFNFAPFLEWRVYAFRSYRDLDPASRADRLPFASYCRQSADERLELDARIFLPGMSAIYSHSPLRLGLSAVIEPRNGSLSYWALRHPAGKPDFHHPDAFALQLDAPEPG